MKQKKIRYNNLITFSRWSRKKYAVLASLGKQIKIGNVRLEICQLALLKADKTEICILFQNNTPIEEESPDENPIVSLGSCLMVAPVKSDCESHRPNNCYFKITSDHNPDVTHYREKFLNFSGLICILYY